MSALQINSLLFDSISGVPSLEGSGQVWYDGNTGRLNLQTPSGIRPLMYSGEVTGSSTFQDIYNNTGNASSFTLGNGGSFTINDQNNPLLVLNDGGTVSLIPGVAGGNAYIGSQTSSGNLTVYGNLTVLGETTTVSSANVSTASTTILLNSGEVGTGVTAGSAGIVIDRGSSTDASVLFIEATDKWAMHNGTMQTNIASENYVNSQILVTSGDLRNSINTATLLSKAGVVAGASFAGNPKTATVTFTTAFADANYSVSIISTANRTWTISSVAAGSFVINANANTALTGNNVYWTAIQHGETVDAV